MQSRESYLYPLLALHRLPGMGPVKLKKIITQIQNTVSEEETPNNGPSGVAKKNLLLEASFSKQGNCLVFPGQADWAAVEKDLIWAQKQNNHIVTIFDPLYPSLLKEIPSAPILLFVTGDVTLLSAPQIAIVGSRNPTSTGRETAALFAKQLVEHNLCITSGLASGIDGAAHRGALQANGKTIAVLANGLDKIYPSQHQKLFYELSERGALVSEFPLGVSPLPSHFPRRNRIISGLSMGTLVVEATLNSGSLITAKYALDQGREIFAIPGSIYSSQAQGCHVLIRQGAKLVETPQDVLEEIESLLEYVSRLNESGSTAVKGRTRAANGNGTEQRPGKEQKAASLKKGSVLEQKVLAHIGFEQTSIDTLMMRSRLTLGRLSSILLELELKGSIEPCIGGYIRVKADH